MSRTYHKSEPDFRPHISQSQRERARGVLLPMERPSTSRRVLAALFPSNATETWFSAWHVGAAFALAFVCLVLLGKVFA